MITQDNMKKFNKCFLKNEKIISTIAPIIPTIAPIVIVFIIILSVGFLFKWLKIMYFNIYNFFIGTQQEINKEELELYFKISFFLLAGFMIFPVYAIIYSTNEKSFYEQLGILVSFIIIFNNLSLISQFKFYISFYDMFKTNNVFIFEETEYNIIGIKGYFLWVKKDNEFHYIPFDKIMSTGYSSRTIK